MAPDSDRGGSGADHLENAPPNPVGDKDSPSSEKRLTPISYLVLGLLVVVWPLSSLLFLDSQLELAKDVSDPSVEIYLPTMLVQLLILLVVAFAVRSEGVGGADIGLRGLTRWTVLQAVGFFFFANLILLFLQTLIATSSPDSFTGITPLLPQTLLQKLTWVVLCAIVAVSEEVTYRGYLMTRLAQLGRGRIWLGVLLSTLSFASGHLYQGPGGFVLIFVYGIMFCLLCLYTGSLYPAIIAHFLQDIVVLILPDKFN